MTVIAFRPKVPQCDDAWRPGELAAMVEILRSEPANGDAGRWNTGVTDIGDPQFYLLGPPPCEECILCISRLGRIYVLEDGAGRVLFEHNSLVQLAEQARRFLQQKKAQIAARAGLIWCGIRAAIEEKIEVVVGEGEELFMHVAPQLAA